MTHLDPDRLVELAERTSGPGDPHLQACERCRGAVDTLRETLREVAAVQVPEPSPLFWDHLSRRVSDAVRTEERPPRASWWPSWRRLAPIGAVAALVLVVATGWLATSSRPGAPSAARQVAPAGGDGQDVGVAEDQDEAWAVVAAVAEGVEAETVEATGIAPAPGSVEEAASELSPAEQEELIRLLRAETAAPSGTEG